MKINIFLKFVSLYAPPFLLMALIFYLSSQSSFPVGDENVGFWADFIIKKIAHMAVFGFLMFLWFRALNDKSTIKKALLWAFVITVLYAISDEYHQTFVPEREGTVRDVLIDTFAAAVVFWGVSRKRLL